MKTACASQFIKAHKKLIECEEGNMMMHRDHMAKRQEVCAGHIGNMLILCLYLM